MESITTDELKKKMFDNEPIHIVDVRENEETAKGIIPGATTIPMNEIPDNLNEFNENDTYYIICAAGVRCANVVNYLKEQNPNIHAVNVEGGMKAWGDEGLEINSI
ncbi:MULTISPECIES: rhodanese-like domain-containing protein [unclassified Staphylococcus]|uniref:rhodanese-like domain-containing protein n=1 Tax=unclassified Staphylococcus TaxID=91994 RepID=UPI0008A8E4A0|nr:MULTISPECIES: rhodanese-like domain-containing protein [unclassified Staphylococcus]OHR56164.1 sulfurtransferase [Staphylococcus sp. HMSC070A03]OHR56395.1 sulfurtransferase [Staphylococcus sp. HMSC070A02]